MTRQDCREIYFDNLKELEMWKHSDNITVSRSLLEENAECILFLLKKYKGE